MRKRGLPKDAVLYVDPKSNESRKEQIKRQIRIFTQNKNVKREGIVSMDEFRDFAKIERELGPIKLGFDKPPELPKPINEGPQWSEHWKKLAEVLEYGPGKMAIFKKIID